MSDTSEPCEQTRLIHAGRRSETGKGRGFNPPVERLSTVLFDSLAELRHASAGGDDGRALVYGAQGTSTTYALEDWITALEGAYRTRLYPTGLAAVAQMFQAFLRPGQHVLITDSVYGPVRGLVREFLEPFGIQCEFYAADGHDIERRIRPETRMIYAEVPGSLLYEMCDLPALSRLCKERGILLAVDNSWGSGLIYKPLALGADISLMALTKYVAGHSDVMMGSVSTTEAHWPALARMSRATGNTVSPDDAYLVLRGGRTLAPRLALHASQALQIAQWLESRPEVARVLHPALPSDPGHTLWQRDCLGSNGLVSFEFKDKDEAQLARFIDTLRLFGLGYSWGGFESLVSVVERQGTRSVTSLKDRGPMVRLHVGLEALDDLIVDLDAGFAALR
ncbi:cystathionine beta-lyase [Pseudomonas duriflava]|uniref:Cystathionine beta-lyase n=1 Tax=Pseudomonas duriflava TaxID=459528 RepID=A0A562QFU3_9PSED|nr:cystathionine beta-lyase [Pseudomonas duriflava]TWI55040.1 cystathionine beta-lyase [Pseudomonas duriflava]